LGALDLEGGLAKTLQQVLGSATTLLEVDRVGLMLVDPAGALHWAGASDRVVEASSGDLSVPVQVGYGPVGTLDVYVTASREWDDSEVAALQTYAGLVASLLAAAVSARVTGRLADQLHGALEHRSLIDQAAALPSDRLVQAKAERREATDLEVAVHRRDSELHEAAARRARRIAGPQTISRPW
jgi:hypothetical protein